MDNAELFVYVMSNSVTAVAANDVQLLHGADLLNFLYVIDFTK